MSLKLLESISQYFVYEYPHLDDLRYMANAALLLEPGQPQEEVIDTIGELFLQRGWDGEGLIQAMWLPPFVCPEGNDEGVLIYHVQQSPDGPSLLASPVELPFDFFREQNRHRRKPR